MKREKYGMEGILLFFTGKRTYRCCRCFCNFRAPDKKAGVKARAERVAAAGTEPGTTRQRAQ
jgi:hypothetical protein